MPEMSETLPIAVAMSGGVDSSTVAALLVRQGHRIVGMTMQLWNQRRLPELSSGGSDGPLLLARRCLRRAPRGRTTRRALLRGQFRAPVRGPGGEAVRRRVSRRPHARALHALQQLHQVRPLPRNGRRRGRRIRSPPATTRASATTKHRAAMNCCAAWITPRIRLIFCSASRSRSLRARCFRWAI